MNVYQSNTFYVPLTRVITSFNYYSDNDGATFSAILKDPLDPLAAYPTLGIAAAPYIKLLKDTKTTNSYISVKPYQLGDYGNFAVYLDKNLQTDIYTVSLILKES